MDNRLFSVNGKGKEMLRKALELAFMQEGNKTTAEAWIETKEHGLILSWFYEESNHNKFNKFLTPLSSDLATEIVWEWLSKAKIEDFKMNKWEENLDHDGENIIGWHVYVGDWGHIHNITSAICAIKPVYLWLGK